MTDSVQTHSETTPVNPTTTSWLSDLRVISTGSSTILDTAVKTLRQYGAHVVAIENRGPCVAVDVFRGADIVLVDRTEGAHDLPGRLAGPAAKYIDHVTVSNRAVWVTISPYGLFDGRWDAVASELTLLGAGGFLGHQRFPEDLPPTISPGSLGLKTVGVAAAVAALHGLHGRIESERPIHVDVSAQAVLVATGLALEMGHVLAQCPAAGGSLRYGAPVGFFRCLGGSLHVVVLEQHQWEGFRSALAPRLDSIRTLDEARDRADEVNDAMAEWASTQKAADAERTLQAAGVPCTSVNTVRNFVERSKGGGRNFDVEGPSAPALPAVVTEVCGKTPTARSRGIIRLQDLRVLDAGNVLAVPLGAAWIGAMGAQVTKVEDPERLDIYRRRGPFADGRPGLNRGGYFNHINFCKTSMDVIVDETGGSLDASEFDVVMQNATVGRAAQVGIDAESVTAHDTPKLAITASGFGRTGAWSQYRAYGHNVHAFCGVTAATRDPLGNMSDVGVPLADVLTSVALGGWVLAWSLAPKRSSSFVVDISMAELMAAQLTDLLDVEAEDGYGPAPVGGDIFVSISGSQQLLAVSLRDQDEVDRYERIVSQRLPRLTRRGQLVDIEPIGTLASVRDLDERLRDDGLPSALVLNARELAVDEFLRSTGLFQTVTSAALGNYDVVGLPWRFLGAPRAPIFAAPERPMVSA